jgi:hypothetical protein
MPEGRTAVIGLPEHYTVAPVVPAKVEFREYSLFKISATRFPDEEVTEVEIKIDKRLEKFIARHAQPNPSISGIGPTVPNLKTWKTDPSVSFYDIYTSDNRLTEGPLGRLRTADILISSLNAGILRVFGLSEGKKIRFPGLYTDEQIKTWIASLKEVAYFIGDNYLKQTEIKTEIIVKEAFIS